MKVKSQIMPQGRLLNPSGSTIVKLLAKAFKLAALQGSAYPLHHLLIVMKVMNGIQPGS